MLRGIYPTKSYVHADLKVPTIREETTKFSVKYRDKIKVPTIREETTKFIVKYRDKITTHPNELASTLLEEEETRRLKTLKSTYLTTRFS
jgi:hypothetical protein